MNSTSRFAQMLAWVLLALVVCACVDMVPDDPAVLKQLERHEASWDQDVRCTVQIGQVSSADLASTFSPDSVALQSFGDETLLPASEPRSLRLAADSSPPYHLG